MEIRKYHHGAVLRHCDGSIRLWDQNSQTDTVVAPSVREFVSRIEE